MTIFSKLTPAGLKFVQAHEGINEIREIEYGTYELVLQDGNVVGATVDGEQLTLMIPEDENTEFIHFRTMTDTQRIEKILSLG
ncbi:MAG: hypothetical protein HZY76_07090 [Anaerolineae bacterium]|nr:MAG: hypothetical protein HZY76_07090 [Anaerolineae bacterium]